LQYVEYEVTTTWSYNTGPTWSSTVQRRFNDFAWLHTELGALGPLDFELPSRHWLGNLSGSYSNDEFIEERRHQLKGYLKGLVILQDCWNAKALQVFLGADAATMASSKLDSRLDSMGRYLNQPVSFNLDDEITKASFTLHNIMETLEVEEVFSPELVDSCAGIAFLTMARGGLMFSGRIGTGLVIARMPNGDWSAPSALGAAGAGWGMQLGGEVTDAVIVLSDREAVEAFAGSVQVGAGTELSVSIGPVGVAAETSVHIGESGPATSFSSSHGRGMFMGLSVQAMVYWARHEINEAFYGEAVSTYDLLDGRHPRPAKAAPLYSALARIFDSRLAARRRTSNALYPIESLRPPPIPPASSRQCATSEVVLGPSQNTEEGPQPPEAAAPVEEDPTSTSGKHETELPPPVAVAVGVVAVAMASKWDRASESEEAGLIQAHGAGAGADDSAAGDMGGGGADDGAAVDMGRADGGAAVDMGPSDPGQGELEFEFESDESTIAGEAADETVEFKF
jgi:lipid-binding SYLF domain-containing protein